MPWKSIEDRGLSTAVGDEGGFAPNLEGTEDALELHPWSYQKAAGCEQTKDVMIGMDCASSILSWHGIYDYASLKVPKAKETYRWRTGQTIWKN